MQFADQWMIPARQSSQKQLSKYDSASIEHFQEVVICDSSIGGCIAESGVVWLASWARAWIVGRWSKLEMGRVQRDECGEATQGQEEEES